MSDTILCTRKCVFEPSKSIMRTQENKKLGPLSSLRSFFARRAGRRSALLWRKHSLVSTWDERANALGHRFYSNSDRERSSRRGISFAFPAVSIYRSAWKRINPFLRLPPLVMIHLQGMTQDVAIPRRSKAKASTLLGKKCKTLHAFRKCRSTASRKKGKRHHNKRSEQSLKWAITMP